MDEKMVKISIERIEQAIFLIQGQKVLLDADLAQLYGVETKILNKAVKRNLDRFPEGKKITKGLKKLLMEIEK